ncbi:glycoside hydrolase family 66 protein [Paenibacillaceae bacterium WGS1546]|uniref:glycoside hydrolase family 66 protein n=1 Tax=Cohnella sp. WGS1546 TaxID=3366810 RepID=UPI00372D6443
MIIDLYPLKAQFRSGEPVAIAVELGREEDSAAERLLRWRVCRLDKEMDQGTANIRLKGGERKTIPLELPAYHADFDGYGLDVDLIGADGAVLQTCSTSFDVVSDWRRSTRYGFLSDFHTRESGDEEDVKWMNKLHLNLVQFYDWMYRHDDLVADCSEYTDLMGRELNLNVVKEKVGLCQRYGMKAVAYGAVYAASKPFAERHPDWALYRSDGRVYDFIDIFTIMNIAEWSPWHRHIIGEYKRAVELVGFDGIHMDTYGFPKTGIAKRDGVDTPVRLEEHFPRLIDRTREELTRSKEDIALIFNNVGNWPVASVARSKQDAVYVEVWKPYERYHHIRQILREAGRESDGKPVILAAYLQPFRIEDDPERAKYACLLLTAVIFSHGGYHLLAGEHAAVLTQAYYADYTTVSESFAAELRRYYDFQIRYANLLYDGTLRDVSMTHADGDNLEYVFDGLPYSTYGEAGKVWTVIRENENRKTISLINLTGNAEDYWNEGKNRPERLTDVKIRVLLERDAAGAFMASPDIDLGRARPLAYEMTNRLRGRTMELTIPAVDVWTVIWIDLE